MLEKSGLDQGESGSHGEGDAPGELQEQSRGANPPPRPQPSSEGASPETEPNPNVLVQRSHELRESAPSDAAESQSGDGSESSEGGSEE